MPDSKGKRIKADTLLEFTGQTTEDFYENKEFFGSIGAGVKQSGDVGGGLLYAYLYGAEHGYRHGRGESIQPSIERVKSELKQNLRIIPDDIAIIAQVLGISVDELLAEISARAQESDRGYEGDYI